MWSTLSFGKYKGKSLPQVILSDPDWFSLARGNSVFKGRFAREARDLDQKASRIKVPKANPGKWQVEYRFERDGRFFEFGFVKAGAPFYSRGSVRSVYLDLSYFRRASSYDKKGGQ